MFQTSYFSSKAPKARKVSIAKWAPRYWQGPKAPRLAPTDPRTANWAAEYRKDLEERFPQGAGLAEYLAEIAQVTPNPILCCYEADPNECHRRVLAAYIREMLNWNVPEWGDKAPEQASLF